MKIVNIALSQKGMKENRLNEIIYNTWYYNKLVYGGQYPYCAVFISWCANKAGIEENIIPKTASVKSMLEFFRKKGLYHLKETKYNPIPGDLMFQKSNNALHIGIVVAVTAFEVLAIEGNSGIGVEMNSYLHSDPLITGYATPDYLPEFPGKLRLLSANLLGNSSNTNSAILSEQQIWNWFRSKGYSETSTAGIMGRLSQETTSYSPNYSPIRLWNGVEVGGMGLFQWTWDGEVISDLSEGRSSAPNSRLAKYLQWCDENGLAYESAANQLNYFWEHDLADQAWSAQMYCNLKDFSPASMNTLTTEQAALNWTIGFERGQPANEVTAAQNIYSTYSGSSIDSSSGNLSGTVNDGVNEVAMRTSANVKTITNAGRYTYIQYVVSNGDTLESIALKYNVAPQMILFANDLNSWSVSAGETIYIPQAAGILSVSEAQSGVGTLEQLKHSTKVEVSSPMAYVQFYGEYGKLAAKSTLSSDKNERVDNDIISINTSRSMSQDCSTFTLKLVWRNKWYDNLASNDLIVIQLWRPPEESNVVFYGLIDDIRKSMDFSSTQPQRVVQVTGRGFNKAFCHFDIGLITNYSTLDMGTGFFTALTQLSGVGSSEAIRLVVDSFLGKGLKYKFGNNKSFSDYFEYNGTIRSGERLLDIKSFTSFNGSMWNFIKELGNAPFNETFWEIHNNKIELIHRPTPFLKGLWEDLNRLEIKDYDIVADNTGRSDLETYTVYNVHMTLLGEETRNIFPPAWYPPYYFKYGLRELKVNTIYEVNGNRYEPREYTSDLFNYNIKNNVMENGTITLKGSNKYKIGERVILESSNIEYYVEGVSHSFNMYDSWITSLTVTRGINPNERFTVPYGAAEDLTPTIMMSLIKLTESGHIDWWNLPEREFGVRNADGTSTTGYTNSSSNTNSSSSNSSQGDTVSTSDFGGKTFIWPAPQCHIITSPFGPRDTGISGASTYHKGIDIACEGDSEGLPIIAACDGVVEYAGYGYGYGNFIEISHGDGVTTRYAHMWTSGILVSEGQTVSAGDHIANIGAAGIGSGAHLHFEVRINGEAINPEEVLP